MRGSSILTPCHLCPPLPSIRTAEHVLRCGGADPVQAGGPEDQGVSQGGLVAAAPGPRPGRGHPAFLGRGWGATEPVVCNPGHQ